VKHGLIASGDIFVSRREDIDRIKALYPDVMAVDMESAAIAHVCHLKSVPFVCIRVVSDTPGAADNIEQYETFWDDAPQHTFETLTQLLNQL
jgi:adenosylhomocysteine nucleosidase